MSDQPAPPRGETDELIRAGTGEAEIASPGSMRAALASAMVGMKAKYYGKGPTRAKAYLEDQYVFIVLDGGLTPHEEVLLADGKEDEVRSYRLSFEESMRETATQAVAEIVGREVLDYQSQIVFSPPRTLEWFVLADET